MSETILTRKVEAKVVAAHATHPRFLSVQFATFWEGGDYREPFFNLHIWVPESADIKPNDVFEIQMTRSARRTTLADHSPDAS